MKKQDFYPTDDRENLDGPLDEKFLITKESTGNKLKLVINGTCVSWLTVLEFRQQIGTELLRMGGIGGVATDKAHRLKGYSRRLINSAIKWMRMSGFDTSMLFGISSFYPKFGYGEAFPDVSFTLAVRDAELVNAQGYSFVNYKSQYLQSILNMYHRNNAGRTGPIRRHPKHWKHREPFTKGTNMGCRVALDNSKRPVAYFVYDATPLNPTILEVGFTTSKVFSDMLLAIARIVWNDRLERIKFFLPEDDAFIAFCQPLGLEKTMGYRKDGGGMVRMINIPGSLSKISPLLGSRLRTRGHLNIYTNLESIGLSWLRGRCNVSKPQNKCPSVYMPQWALAQLLYGYRNAFSLYASGTVKGSKHSVDILENLFPVTPHFFYWVDRF
jgi:predicted acetyltransferase